MCANSGYYNYTTDPGKNNYVWTISSGGTITGGQNTATLEVTWNTTGAQFVTVNYSNPPNNCPAQTPTVFNVTVAGLPGAAGTINGSSNVCSNSTGVAYAVPAITNASSYVWSLPPGATIATGEFTNTITVNFAANATSGNITVYGNSLCGNGAVSPTFPVTVNQIPGTAGTITGSASVCEGATGVAYSVPAIASATGYVWTLPAGASIASGANTANITVNFPTGSVSGAINVYGTNLCGIGAVSANFDVTVQPKPSAPVISLAGDILSSDVSDGNQWYYNGAMINGETGQTMQALYDGWYWDVITKNGCLSDTSNNIYVTITGIEEPQGSHFVITPIPNNGCFKITISTPNEQTFTIKIYNQLGEMIYESKDNRVKGLFDKNIDLRPLPSGLYSVTFQSAENRVVKKVIIN